jgi:hypothetical protein
MGSVSDQKYRVIRTIGESQHVFVASFENLDEATKLVVLLNGYLPGEYSIQGLEPMNRVATSANRFARLAES